MASPLIKVNFDSFEQSASNFGSIHDRVESTSQKVKDTNRVLATGWVKDGAPACKDIAEICEKHFYQIATILATEKQSITQAASIYTAGDKAAGSQFE